MVGQDISSKGPITVVGVEINLKWAHKGLGSTWKMTLLGRQTVKRLSLF